MRNYTLKNYEEQLTHQVIHMDQAVCYNPEYRATRKMHDYPSRKLQLARAVYKDEIEVNEFIGGLVFSSILSRQGERWQNFRENQEDCTDTYVLCREMLIEKGYDAPAAKAFAAYLDAYGGHAFPAENWKLPVAEESDMYILIDDAAAYGFAEGEAAFRAYCEKNALAFVNEAEPVFLGFEYFAYGLVEDGIRRLTNVVEAIRKTGAKKVLVLSAQAAYLLRVMTAKVGIETGFEVVYLPEILDPIITDQLTYVYAGSFNTRYLCNADLLNGLVPNTQEEFDKTSVEFIPLLQADHRCNRLTIWQKPVGAEYKLFGMSEEIINAIKEDAFGDIRKTAARAILVFEPTAVAELSKAFPALTVKSYLEML